jgi:hypothetical protein
MEFADLPFAMQNGVLSLEGGPESSEQGADLDKWYRALPKLRPSPALMNSPTISTLSRVADSASNSRRPDGWF